jgi:hypothetical protein
MSLRRGLAVSTCRYCAQRYKSLMQATSCCLGKRRRAARDIHVPASRPQKEIQSNSGVQHQLSLNGSGDFCRLGCCDFSQKFAKHSCKREQRS